MSSPAEKLFSALPDMLCSASISGMFLTVNPSFSRILGHRTSDLLNRPFMDFVHEDDRQDTQSAVVSLAAGGKVVGFQNRYRKADGSFVRLDWYAVMSDGVIYASARPVCEYGCCCALGYETMAPADLPLTTENVKAVLRHTRLVADECKRMTEASAEAPRTGDDKTV